MKVLVCGSRHFNQLSMMVEELKKYFVGPGDTLIHGCAKGADMLSEAAIMILFSSLGTMPSIKRYPADWDKHGKAAGPIRNKQMLEEGKPDLVIAFMAKDSRGTKNMVDQATKAGVEVKVIDI